MKNGRFSGKILLMGEYFRQTTNIVPRGLTADTIEPCIKSSQFNMEAIHLTSNMRSVVQEDFNDWIFSIGDGQIDNNAKLDKTLLKIPDKFLEENNIIGAIYSSHVSVNSLESIS